MRHPAGETITITREGVPITDSDDAGNPIIGEPTEFAVADVALEPIMAEEAPGVFSIVGYKLYCPFVTSFEKDDRLTIRGIAGWQVEGDTEATGWRNPFNGSTPGMVAIARKAS